MDSVLQVQGPDLQTLRLIDLESGRLIAHGHDGPEDNAEPEVVAWARTRPGTAMLRKDEVLRAGVLQSVWTLQVLRLVNAKVALVGGRILSPEWLEALHKDSREGTFAALEDRGGALVVATFEGEPSNTTHDRLAAPLRGMRDGDELGTLRLYIDRGPLLEAAQERWTTAGAVALLSAILALFVGWWTSRRLTRPLERLVSAAGAIAEGTRDERLPTVKGGGEVAELTLAFNRMTEELSESERLLRDAERVAAWREIAQGIAHELLNPLSPVKMSIETLQKVHERKHPDFEEVFEESTGTILEEVERMRRIVTEFRDFARLPAPQLRPTDLSSLLRSVVVLHRDLSSGVEVRWEGPEEVVLMADADQMTAVATNLVKNAIEAHGASPKPGACVIVRLAAPTQHALTWSVSDNGPGMKAEVQDKLFTPYFTTKRTGTGLGLAITQRHIVEHGGRIRVASELGRGTRFEVLLPLTSSREERG